MVYEHKLNPISIYLYLYGQSGRHAYFLFLCDHTFYPITQMMVQAQAGFFLLLSLN